MLPDVKGRALERAVQAIEAVILASSPGLREDSFKIEARKIVTVDGVHHEIDIFVTVEAAKGYRSTFIFECKNWKAAVGKNEIIVFSKKIEAVSAQRGYFVAKSFTKDAAAQAQEYARITLLIATEHNPATTITPDSFHITAPASMKPSITFRIAGSSGTTLTPINVQETTARVNGQELLLIEYLNAWTRELYEERLLHFNTAQLAEGIHPMAATAERFFGAGDCIINEQAMEYARMDAAFEVHIYRPAVISHYEVASRGRVMQLETVNIHDIAINTSFVKTLTD